jgi:hypothetical protein
MSDPAVTTTTEPPTPGWLSKLVAFGVAIAGALPFSGLLDGHPVAGKCVGLVLVGLAAVGYSTHATALREVHATASAAGGAL